MGRVKNSAWRSAGARDRPNAYAAPLTLRGPGDGPRLCGVSTDLARLLFGQDRVAAGDGTYRHTLELEAAEGALRYLQEQLPADSPDLATLASAVRAARAIHDLRRTPIFQQAREDAQRFSAIMRRLSHVRRSRGMRRHVRRVKAGLA